MHWVTQYGTDMFAGLSYYDAAHYSTLKLVKNRIGFKEDFSLLITSLCQSLHQYWRSSSSGSQGCQGSSRTSSHQLHPRSPVKQFKIETDGRRKRREEPGWCQGSSKPPGEASLSCFQEPERFALFLCSARNDGMVTCRGRSGKLEEVTLMARDRRWRVRSRQSESKVVTK